MTFPLNVSSLTNIMNTATVNMVNKMQARSAPLAIQPKEEITSIFSFMKSRYELPSDHE